MFKIHFKLSVFYAVFTSFLFFIIYLLMLDYIQNFNYRETQDGLRSDLFAMRSAIQENTRLNDLEYLKKLSESVQKDLNDRLTLIDRNGTVLFDSDVPVNKLKEVNNHSNRLEFIQAFQSGFGESRHYSQTVNRDMIYQAILITNRSKPYILRLSLPFVRLQSLSGNFGNYLVTILLIILLISMLTGYIVFRFFTAKLDRMIDWARKIASGDYSESIIQFSRDEVGQLSESLNAMSAEFRAKIDDLDISRVRLEKLIMTLMDGILAISQDGNIILTNDSLKQYLALDAGSDLTGKKYYEVIRNHNTIELIEATIGSDDGMKKADVHLVTDREWFFEIYGIPVFKNRKLDWAVFVFHDVTEIRQLEDKRKDFVANVSHELKTPISIIKGYSETLLNGALDDRQNAMKFLELIDTDATRLSKLVDDLLKLSGIESGLIQPELNPCSIGSIAKKVCEKFQKMAADKGIELVNQVPAGLPDILADEDKIEEVLINLIDNALKYSPEKGLITVSAVDTGDQVVVSVTDNGIGIPKDKIPRLFERFYRVDTGRSRKLGGTGLGLAIVKHIVQSHNGNVEVKSQPGEGSTFSFSIPKTN